MRKQIDTGEVNRVKPYSARRVSDGKAGFVDEEVLLGYFEYNPTVGHWVFEPVSEQERDGNSRA